MDLPMTIHPHQHRTDNTPANATTQQSPDEDLFEKTPGLSFWALATLNK
jgi:hypothetical protein